MYDGKPVRPIQIKQDHTAPAPRDLEAEEGQGEQTAEVRAGRKEVTVQGLGEKEGCPGLFHLQEQDLLECEPHPAAGHRGPETSPFLLEPVSFMKGRRKAPQGAVRIWGHLNGTATRERPVDGLFFNFWGRRAGTGWRDSPRACTTWMPVVHQPGHCPAQPITRLSWL